MFNSNKNILIDKLKDEKINDLYLEDLKRAKFEL